MRLKDRVAIVTGGGYGIGHTYSLGIVREGGTVVIADINDEAAQKTAHAIRAEGGEALAVHTDVSEPASLTAMVQAAVDRFGRVETPADLLGPLVYLCSSDSDFVTGQALVVDGGAAMY